MPRVRHPQFHNLVSRYQPAWAIGTKIVIRCHRIRHSRGSGNPEGKGGTNHTQTLPTTRPHFHTLVCRRQPAWAIGTKIVIRCHRIRHSRGSGNPEGKGGTNHTQTPPTTRSHFHTLVCRRQPAWAIGTKIVIRCHRIRHSRGSGNPEGKGGTNHTQTPPTTRRESFSYLRVPAPAGMRDCYESMSRTPIRDRPLRQPLIRHSRHPFAIRDIPSSIRPPIRHSGDGAQTPPRLIFICPVPLPFVIPGRPESRRGGEG